MWFSLCLLEELLVHLSDHLLEMKRSTKALVALQLGNLPFNLLCHRNKDNFTKIVLYMSKQKNSAFLIGWFHNSFADLIKAGER